MVTRDARIEEFLGGDRDAGEQLLLELLPRVRNVVRALVGRDSDVDDIAQQVMVEVIRSLGSFRGECALAGWVDRITVRVALAHARSTRARVLVETPTVDGELEAHADLVVLPSAGGERYVQKRHAVTMLDQLPLAQKTAVVLHYVLGFTINEIAAHERTSAETVRSRLRVGMGKLRDWSKGDVATPAGRVAQ
jgi:RNA polymerase sigma-70 factor (ECF subfamily)